VQPLPATSARQGVVPFLTLDSADHEYLIEPEAEHQLKAA
jgi:hypothetical protein